MSERDSKQRVRIDSIVRGIASGTYDDVLTEIETALHERKELRRKEVLALVQEVYGPDATVTMTRDAKLPSPPPSTPPSFQPEAARSPVVNNPFIPEGVVVDPDLHSPGADPEVSAREQEMESDIESRGAQIGPYPPPE